MASTLVERFAGTSLRPTAHQVAMSGRRPWLETFGSRVRPVSGGVSVPVRPALSVSGGLAQLIIAFSVHDRPQEGRSSYARL